MGTEGIEEGWVEVMIGEIGVEVGGVPLDQALGWAADLPAEAGMDLMMDGTEGWMKGEEGKE